MAALPNIDRINLWALFMSDSSRRRELIPLDKTSMREIIDTMDQAVDVFVDKFDTPPSSPIAQLSMRQRLELIEDNIERRLAKL